VALLPLLPSVAIKAGGNKGFKLSQVAGIDSFRSV
jgi:hypothetical protein